jgi:hypothetical protein
MYCLVQETKSYEDVLTYVASIEENSSKMLSPFPKYIAADGKVQKTIHLKFGIKKKIFHI